MKNPGALGVDDLGVGVAGLGGRKARADGERADVGGSAIFAFGFGGEPLAVAVEHGIEGAVRVALGVGEEQGEITGDGLVDPLVAVGRPANDVAPPLMGDFVEGHEVGKKLLAGDGDTDAFLGFVGQERKGGEIEQARPALAEGAGNLRNAEILEGKRAGIDFVKADGGVDLLGQLVQRGGRAWRQRGSIGDGVDAEARAENGGVGDFDGAIEERDESLLELFVGVDVDHAIFRGDGSGGVLAEIETGLRDGKLGFPVGDARVVFVMLIAFGAGGNEAETAGPMEGEVVVSEFGGVAVVRIPVVTGADEEHSVASVFDDGAAIAEVKGEGGAGGRGFGQEDAEGVFAAGVEFLLRDAFVLKEEERFAGFVGDAIDF